MPVKREPMVMAGATRFGVAHGDVDASGKRRGTGAHDINQPLGVVTASGGDHAIAVPYMVHLSNGERPTQEPRIYDINEPCRTVVAQGVKQGLCEATLAPVASAQVAAILKHYYSGVDITTHEPADIRVKLIEDVAEVTDSFAKYVARQEDDFLPIGENEAVRANRVLRITHLRSERQPDA